MSRASGTPAVTAVIIFLDEERYLAAAVESVLAQTSWRWELLLVDDGSTDGSSDIARTYAAQHPHTVRYLEHAGHASRGMSASRNLGIRHARGTYLAFLDGDDVWEPEKLERQLAILEAEASEAAMVHGPLLAWYGWTGREEDRQRDRLHGVGDDGRHPYADSLVSPPDLVSLFLRHEDFIPAGILVRKDAALAVGGFEESFRGSYEDAVFHVKLCLEVPVWVSSECWYKYRIHPDSCERREARRGRLNANHRRFLEWTEGYLTARGVDSEPVWQALRQAQRRCRHDWWYRWFDVRRQLLGMEDGVVRTGRRVLPEPVRRWLWQRYSHLRHHVLRKTA